MRVLFKQAWFGPGDIRYRKSINKFDTREVPDDQREFLPRSAVVVETPEVEPEAPVETLRDFDQDRKDADVFAEKIATAEKFQAELLEAQKAQASDNVSTARRGPGRPRKNGR